MRQISEVLFTLACNNVCKGNQLQEKAPILCNNSFLDKFDTAILYTDITKYNCKLPHDVIRRKDEVRAKYLECVFARELKKMYIEENGYKSDYKAIKNSFENNLYNVARRVVFGIIDQEILEETLEYFAF